MTRARPWKRSSSPLAKEPGSTLCSRRLAVTRCPRPPFGLTAKEEKRLIYHTHQQMWLPSRKVPQKISVLAHLDSSPDQGALESATIHWYFADLLQLLPSKDRLSRASVDLLAGHSHHHRGCRTKVRKWEVRVAGAIETGSAKSVGHSIPVLHLD